MVEILPAILERDLLGFEKQLKKVFGLVDRVQVDIVDEMFGEPTLKPSDLASVDTIIEFDYHLMVKEPVDLIRSIPISTSTYVYGHVEHMTDIAEFLGEAEGLGFGAGLALDIDTSLDKVKDFLYDIDGLCLLSVKAGKQGQIFDPRVLKKIEEARKIRHDLRIVVDGGLNASNIRKCIAAEWAIEMSQDEFERDFLNIAFAVGSKLIDSDDVPETLKRLQILQEE